MVFSRFIASLLAFVLSIVGTAVLLGIYLQKPEFPVTRSLLILFLVAETAAMIWYLTRIRRDLLRLVNALSNNDPTLQFSRVRKDPYFSAIHTGFNALIRDFRLVRLEREAEHQFFEETVDHVRFGLVAFNADGAVHMVNRAFLDLFGLDKMSRLEELEQAGSELVDFLKNFEAGNETLKRLEVPGGSKHLMFLASGFTLREEQITLVSVRDISREIDRNELEAWQKLLRVLRHEILNSISPIQLIASNLSDRLISEKQELSLEKLSKEEIQDILTGLDTIHRRASGLSVFLDAYSNLYRTPDFRMESTPVEDVFYRVEELFREQVRRQGVTLTITNSDLPQTINMDVRMIEQVLINLVKNALEALKDSPEKTINLSSRKQKDQAVLLVRDSGAGIPEDQRESIFIPFYSTKENGSGIGLSFAQHVMNLHDGYIQVASLPGRGSEFRLVFRYS